MNVFYFVIWHIYITSNVIFSEFPCLRTRPHFRILLISNSMCFVYLFAHSRKLRWYAYLKIWSCNCALKISRTLDRCEPLPRWAVISLRVRWCLFLKRWTKGTLSWINLYCFINIVSYFIKSGICSNTGIH